MNSITLKTLPCIKYAHRFTSNGYTSILPPFKHLLEIGYVSKGSFLFNSNNLAQENEVYIFSRWKPTLCHSTSFNTHHCVGIELDADTTNLPHVTILNAASSNQLKQLIDELILLWNIDPPPILNIQSLILQLLVLINEHWAHSSNEIQQPSEIFLVEKIKSYIAQHISQPINLQDIAATLRYSISYICILFKKITGETIISYANNQKISLLKNLIIHKNISLKEACQQVGISDPAYASRLFKKINHSSLREVLSSRPTQNTDI